MSWALVRVDDRLIHGQVVIAWGHRLRLDRIWVVDPAAAADPWERELLQSAAPGAEVRVLTVEEAAAAWDEESRAAGAALLLVRNLVTALRLVEAGAEVRTLNLGGLHYAPGKTRVNDYVFLDDHDREAVRALLARGVRLEVQDVPASRAQALTSLEPGLLAS